LGKTQFPIAIAGVTYIITVIAGVNGSKFRKIVAFLNEKKITFLCESLGTEK
jgi:hypothetical protein